MIKIKEKGLQDYNSTWQEMVSFTEKRNNHTEDELWTLEHRSVFTQGLSGKPEHLLKETEIEVIKSDRGGQITYHGPGQLVIYFLLDFKKLNMGPKTLVETLQKFVQSILDEFDIESSLIAGAPGVYVDDKKIASIGLRISNGKTYHGISMNIDMDLEPFSFINPCGYEGLKVVQLKDYVNNIAIKDVEKLAIKKLENIF